MSFSLCKSRPWDWCAALIRMLPVSGTAGEQSWLLCNQTQTSHWLLLGSDLPRVDHNPGAASGGPTMQSLFLQCCHNQEQQEIPAKLPCCAQGSHSPRAHPANNSFLEDASYLFFPLLRGVGEKMLLEAPNEGQHIPIFFCWAVPGQFKWKNCLEHVDCQHDNRAA